MSEQTSTPVRSAAPLVTGEQGGPLSRELITVKLARLMYFLNRDSTLAFARTSGLTDLEWRSLAWVCETPPLSLNQLTDLLQRDVGQISRTVKKLVSAGLLRKAARGGGPGVLLTPTALGRTVYGPLVALSREADAAISKGLSEADLQVMDRCIQVMTQNAVEHLALERARQADTTDDLTARRAGRRA